eukprot:1252857-Rhodomonas_salina.1
MLVGFDFDIVHFRCHVVSFDTRHGSHEHVGFCMHWPVSPPVGGARSVSFFVAWEVVVDCEGAASVSFRHPPIVEDVGEVNGVVGEEVEKFSSGEMQVPGLVAVADRTAEVTSSCDGVYSPPASLCGRQHDDPPSAGSQPAMCVTRT